MSDDALTIERLHVIYHIADDYPELDRARGKLDRILRHDLVAACEQAFARQSLQGQASICLIRKLHFDVTLDVSAFEDSQIAQTWGDALAGEINAALAIGSDNVIFFQNAAYYLAQFLLDLASGAAWGKWYYDAFVGLSALPAGAAAREALTRDSQQGLQALRILSTRNQLEWLLAILTEEDAQRVFASFLRVEESLVPTRAALEAVLAIWSTIYFQNSIQDALRLLAALPLECSGAAAVELLLQFSQVLSSSLNRTQLIDAIVRRDLAGIERSVAPRLAFSLPRLIELIDGDEIWLSQIVRTIIPGAELSKDLQAQPATLVTPYSGAFLLLMALCDDGLNDALESLAGEDAALLRLSALAKSLGDSNVLYDPVLHYVLDVKRAPAESDWQRINNLAGDDLLRRMIEQLKLLGKASGRCLLAERVRFAGQDCVLLRDIEQDFWLSAAPLNREGLIAALNTIEAATGQAAECLLLTETIPEVSAIAIPLVLTTDTSDTALLPVHFHDAYTRFIARSKRASVDLEYLKRMNSGLDAPIDFALTLFARNLLHLLAGRFSGFEWSSASYLVENFLEGTGVITLTQAAIEVQFPDKGLSIILRMAGIDGAAYLLPWLPEFEVRLRLPRVTL